MSEKEITDAIIVKIEARAGKVIVIVGGMQASREGLKRMGAAIQDDMRLFAGAIGNANFFFPKCVADPIPFKHMERRFMIPPDIHTFTKPADKGSGYRKAQASKWSNTYSTKVGK